MDYRIITAPVLIPDKADCDHDKGEPPLSIQQIRNLKETFDDYQFIDFDHHLADDDSEWYGQLLGEPVRSWITSTPTTYTNILGVTETIPPGTWWLTTKITHPDVIPLLDDKRLTAYSITVGNKAFCDNFKRTILMAPKNDEQKVPLNVGDVVAFKNKTLIKDIVDPVGFTVSLTGLPCIGSATFSQACYEKQPWAEKNNPQGDENMTETTNETKFSISELLGLQKLFANKNDEEEIKEKEQEENEKSDKKKSTDTSDDKYITEDELDEKLDGLKTELVDIFDEKLEKVVEKLTVKKEEEGEGKEGEGEGKEGEGEDKKQDTANKHDTDTPPQTSQIDNTDDAYNQNTANKHNTTRKAKLMKALNRKPNGEYKFPRNY